MSVEIDATQLAMLLDGIDFRRVGRPKVWEPAKSGQRIDSDIGS